MKIGIDIRNIGKQKTGSEVVVTELTKKLLELDEDNRYLLLTDTEDKRIIDKIRENLNLNGKSNFEIVSLKAWNKFIWAAWAMPRFMRKNKLDVFHTEYILPFFIPKETKVVVHIHDVSFKVYRKMIKKIDLFFLDLLIPLSIKRADKIVAVSEFTKEEIIKYYKVSPDKIEIVFNSINLSERKSDEIIYDEIRKKYNLPENFILYIGTLQPRKNIPILIEAFGKIRKELPEFKLIIAGNKKAHNFDFKIDESIKKSELKEGDDIVFTGFIEVADKTIVYKMAKVFVYPSFYEGFGIPVLEAMSQGVPVLISDIGPHREVAGEAGSYFKPQDVDILADKLYNICVDKNKNKGLIELGLSRVSLFSWEKSAQKMLEIFNSFK